MATTSQEEFCEGSVNNKKRLRCAIQFDKLLFYMCCVKKSREPQAVPWASVILIFTFTIVLQFLIHGLGAAGIHLLYVIVLLHK